MAQWEINKGIGRGVEFKGLRAQYLYLAGGGLGGIFVLTAFLVIAGVNNFFAIVFGVVCALTLIWGVFYLNRTYGVHGLMKLYARRSHPRYLKARTSINKLLTQTKDGDQR